MNPRRRAILASGLWLPAAALAQHHGGLYEQLRQPGRIDKPALAATQNVFDSPAPRAADPGRPVMGGGVQSAVHEAFTLN